VTTEILAYRLKDSFLKYRRNAALQIGNQVWTYEDLLGKATAISNAILKQNKDKGTPVAILGEKSLMTYAGICGAHLSSNAYMPLNLKFPVNRNKRMLELSGAEIIIADEQGKDMLGQLTEGNEDQYSVIIDENLFSSEMSDEPDIRARPEDTAYLLFTSGTTGIPKGVPVSNRNVCAYLDHVLSAWNFREDDRFSQTFDLTFDLSVHDMMVCWLSGACLCVPEDDSPFKLASYIREQKISIWFSVPSAAVLMDKMRLLKTDSLDNLRISFFCGEPLTTRIAEKWQMATSGQDVINLYGPSEATIAISAYPWEKDHQKSKNDIVCLGRMFTEQEYCLLNPQSGKPAKSEGELCLGGSQVIDAYLNDEQLTKKYFVELEEYPSRLWYKTGDLACVDDEGELYFLGRADAEVKISGYRVNLLEIDAIIRKTANADMVASILPDPQKPVILSFISGKVEVGETEIVLACKNELPWYMIPERIIFVDEMPLNVNGKIDRNKLIQMING